jgi:hypothetical protein
MINFFKKQRYPFLIWSSGLLLVLAGLILVEILLAEQLGWQTVGREEILNLRYDSRSRDFEESRVKEYLERRRAGQREIQVRFDLKVYSFEERSVVFQTAPKNRGLRLEFSKLSGIILAIPYRHFDSVKTIPLAEFLPAGEWVSVKLSLDREKHLLVYLNQIQAADLTDFWFDFDIANLTIGGAGGRSSGFDGAIRDFQMEYRLLEQPVFLLTLISVAKILVISLLAILLGVQLTRQIRTLSFRKKPYRPKFFGATGILLGCGALLVIFSYIYQDIWVFETLKEGRHFHSIFDSRSPDPTISEAKPLQESVPPGRKEIQVRLALKAYSLAGYANVFQTAGGNSGIRMELAEPGRLTLVIGVKGLEGIKGIVITNSLLPNEWCAVQIEVDRYNQVKVHVDETLVYDHPHPSLDFSISDLVIGTGFSRSRPFDGIVKDFRFDYRILRERTLLPFLIALFRILFELAVVIWLAWFLKEKFGVPENVKNIGGRVLDWLSWKRWSAGQAALRPALFWGLVSSGLLVFLSAIPDDFQYQTIRSERIRNVSYDEGAEDPALSSGKDFGENLHTSFRDLQVQMEIKPYSLSYPSRIFQTAAGNSGIRLETSPPSRLWLAIGSRGAGGSRKILLTDSLKVGEWSWVVFQIDRKKHLQASINGRKVAHLADHSLEYQIGHIAVGRGSGQFRPFEGAVAEFEMEYRLINKNHDVFSLILGIKILLALAIVPAVVLITVRFGRRFVVWIRTFFRAVLSRPGRKIGIRTLPFLGAGSFVLFLLLSLYGENLRFPLTKAEEIHLGFWDSRSGNPGRLEEPWEYTETFSGQVHRLDLQFEMKVYAIWEFDNVLQTADGNEGLRLELHSPRTVSLVFRDRHRGEVRGVLLTDSLEFDHWYSVRVLRDPSERLKVYWDGDLLADLSDARIGYEVSNIAVGAGFSRSRPLDGAVRDFTLEYHLREENPSAGRAIFALQVISLLVLAASLCLILIRILECRGLPEFLLRVRLFSILLLLGSATQFLFFIVNQFYSGLSYPFNSPFFVPQDRFMDFFNINFRSIMDTRYTEYSAICPPFGFLIARYFSLFADYGHGPFEARDQLGGWISLGIYFTIFFLTLGILCRRLGGMLQEKGIPSWPLNGGLFSLAIFLSYPIWNAMDRGNYIILGFTFFYWILYYPGWKNKASSFSLAGIISLKAHLGIYLLALADRLHWRKFMETLFWLLFLNLIASVILQDFNFLLRITENYGKFSTHFHPASKTFNSPSLFSVLYLFFHERMSPSGFASLERIYSLLSLAALILLAIWVRKRISEINLRFFYLTVGCILLPVASYDYNLILILVFVPYLLSLPEGDFSRMEVALLALALIPKHYLTLYLEPYPTQIGETYLRLTEQILFTPLLLLALLIMGLRRITSRPPMAGTPRARIRESLSLALTPWRNKSLGKSPGISSMNS